MSASRKWASSLDMYRKVPADLMEGTRRGSILSYMACFVMLTLFLLETKAFFQKRQVTDLSLDSNRDPRVRLNFNITMMDLKCEFAVVDVVSVMGENQNVTAHITKWELDQQGIRKRYQGRNRDQQDIELHDRIVTASLEDLHEDGEDAVALDETTLQFAKNEHEYLFVDFYASWCSHCRMLGPTWETLAEVMADVAETNLQKDPNHHEYSDEEYEKAKAVELPVFVAKVDCVTHAQVCQEHQIMAYPTLRLFVDGQPWRGGDYFGHRTVLEMIHYLKEVEEEHKKDFGDLAEKKMKEAHEAVLEKLAGASDEEKAWAEQVKMRRLHARPDWVESEHPGCQLAGHLMLDRVPGNFHIQARSDHHDLVPHMTNVSHFVHHLSIGEPIVQHMIEQGRVQVPKDVIKKIAPMNGHAYVTFGLHEAYQHYLKVITTNVDGLRIGQRDLKAYQILQNSQLGLLHQDVVPEAKFTYDLSPISVSYRTASRHWYDYLTSVFAIVGGTFTVVGMIESSIHVALSRKKNF